MIFAKYHALGNDYVVIEHEHFKDVDPVIAVPRICAAHFGIGADGILLRQASEMNDRFRVRIFNSDGSEPEKSGNGLRIFARYLWDQNQVGKDPFNVETPGGPVTCQVSHEGRTVSIDMGEVKFNSHDIPVAGPPREVINETLEVEGQKIEYSAASIGNPHCIVLRDKVSANEAHHLGPLIETEPRFPNLTNVQFMEVMNRENLRIEIWERGVGYTLASGTSSCAATAVAYRLGLCDHSVTVHMPGGSLQIKISDDFNVRMTGPVVKVADGRLCYEIFSDTTAS